MFNFILSDKELVYVCYYCTKGSSSIADLVHHEIIHHTNQNLSIKIQTLDEKTGILGFKTQHYNQRLEEIKKYESEGYKIVVDTDTVQIRFKRIINKQTTKAETASVPEHLDVPEQNEQEQKHSQQKLLALLEEVLELLKDTDRDSHFISVLETIAAGKRSMNKIALQGIRTYSTIRRLKWD